MIPIKSIIDTLSVEEQQKFIVYLHQKNKRKDAKNVKLFKLLVKNDDDSKAICHQLYGTKHSNAYHALRKRLFQSLIDYSANKNLEDENSIDMQIIKYILASRTYLLQKNYVIAYKILDKAERLADEHLLYPILNEIYHTKIQYAANHPNINLDELIIKQTENQKKHQLEDQLNIVYAKLKSILNAVNHEGKVINFEELLQNTLNDSAIKLNESLSFKSLYQILAIANISALITTQYYQIENFVLKSYAIIKKKKETEKQLYYQIYIVYIIANTLFRNKKFEKSLHYIKEMEHLMRLKNSAYYKNFILKKSLVKALNLNYHNQQNEAIALVESAIKLKHNDLESHLDLQLSLLMFYFQQSDYKKANSILSQFYHTDKWYIEKTGIDWVIKKNLAEILLYIELRDEDLFYSRLKSFKRRYTNYLKQIDQMRILTFLHFAEQYYLNPQSIFSPEFRNKLEISFKWNTVQVEDIFVMSFYAWLKNKIEKGNLYKTTLKLIKM